MECIGKKVGLPQGRKTASLKFGLLDQFFSFSSMGVALVFMKKKTKIIARATRANHKTAASLKIFLLFAQKHGLHLTQLIWSH
ncbi:MAG: hypothetical protein OIF58_08535, partial [Cohaesibacter sp.]|nr:hypothetical protein [Cohaesibacter sp.]